MRTRLLYAILVSINIQNSSVSYAKDERDIKENVTGESETYCLYIYQKQ